MQAFEMQDDNAASQGNIWNGGFSIDRQALMQRARTPKGRICCRIFLGSIALITSVFAIWVISKRVFDNAALTSPLALEAKSMHGFWIFDQSSMFELKWDESKPQALAFRYAEYEEESQKEGFMAWNEGIRDGWKGHLHPKIRGGKHFWEGKVGKTESLDGDETLVSLQYTTHTNQLPTIIFTPPGSADKDEAIRADDFSKKIDGVWKFVFKKTKMELLLGVSGELDEVSLTMMDVTGTGNDIKCRLDRFRRGHLRSTPWGHCGALGRVDIYNDAWHETDPNRLTFMAQSDDPAQSGGSEGEKGKKNQKEYSAWRR